MLKLTELTRTRSDSTSHGRPALTLENRPQSVPSHQDGNRTDQTQLTQQAQQTRPPNPYEGTAPDYARVKVGKWGSGKNDSLLSILYGQNYSRSEIYKKNADGQTLLDQVSQANNLKNPNLIREGQELVVPLKERSPDRPAESSSSGQAPSSNGAGSHPQISQVKVGKWGRDKTGSLFGILSEQGFSRSQILDQDGSGDSLLHKVARANGLSDPNKVQEGASLSVPNSMEALSQMDIPERTSQQRTTVERRQLPEIPTLEPRPIELKPIELPKPKAIELRPLTTPEPQAGAEPSPSVEPTANPNPAGNSESRGTANMGLLLDGVKQGRFKKDEFQYLNALSNRYEETRANFSKDGFNNEELKALGQFETRYGVTYTRLYNSDDIRLTNQTGNGTTPEAQLRIRHYEEGGQLWDGFANGTIDTETAINTMIRQRQEARAQGER